MKKKRRAKVVAVIQARLGSKRLRNKVLKKIQGKSIIRIIYERLKFSRRIDEIVLAIPDKEKDDPLEKEGRKIGVKVFRGSELDIVARMLGSARLVSGDAVVRVTADCPFVDPQMIDKVVGVYKKYPSRYDYLGNILIHKFPIGLGFEIFTVELLRALQKKLLTPWQREQASTYVRTKWLRSRIYNLESKKDLSGIRLTMDWAEDFSLIKKIHNFLYKPGKIYIMSDILRLIRNDSSLLLINKKRAHDK